MRLQVIQDFLGKEILSADKLGSELREEPKTNTLKRKGLLERTKQQLGMCKNKQKLLKKMLDETKDQDGKLWSPQVEAEFHMEFRTRSDEEFGVQGRMKVDQELDKTLTTTQQRIEDLLGGEWTPVDGSGEESDVPPISMTHASEMDMPMEEEGKDKKSVQETVAEALQEDPWFYAPITTVDGKQKHMS